MDLFLEFIIVNMLLAWAILGNGRSDHTTNFELKNGLQTDPTWCLAANKCLSIGFWALVTIYWQRWSGNCVKVQSLGNNMPSVRLISRTVSCWSFWVWVFGLYASWIRHFNYCCQTLNCFSIQCCQIGAIMTTAECREPGSCPILKYGKITQN